MSCNYFLFAVFTFQFLLSGSFAQPADVSVDAQVLIIGAGPAGLYASSTLNANNITDYIILEGADHLRGYVNQLTFGGIELAPGFLWSYGTAANDQFGIPYRESNYSSYTVYTDEGDDITRVAIKRENNLHEAFNFATDAIIEDIDEGVRPDLSQKATLARGGWIANSAVDKVMEWFNFDFAEGRSARDTSTIQAFRQAELIPDDYFILGSVDPALEPLESILTEEKVRLNQRVTVVNQTEGYVRAVTEDGTEYIGNYAIVTSTLGVIQNGGITFDPPLPPWKTEEFCRFQMGTIDPIFLKFETKFWDDTEYILHATDRHGYYPAFLNVEAEGLHPPGTNILIGFLTGDEAFRAELLTDDEVKAEILEVLRNIYGEDNVPDPVEFYMSRFATDPDFYGSFPTWPIGIIPTDAQMRLSANVGRLYFAPEGAGSVEFIGILREVLQMVEQQERQSLDAFWMEIVRSILLQNRKLLLFVVTSNPIIQISVVRTLTRDHNQRRKVIILLCAKCMVYA
ncbi:uncharacterized protein [Amphiura filiformis]|uniref:uncharacterized protein n=1 Tax=Amphiura filiformis TaxID=82378 RepID=UPI003B20C90B